MVSRCSIIKSESLNQQSGFTLIEVMIVLSIIAVLAAIAYPSYIGFQERGIRTEAMAELEHIAGRIESNKLIYKRYDNIPLTEIFSNNVATDGSTTFPNYGAAYYTITVTPINGDKTKLGGRTWSIIATPIATARMANDDTLTLRYTGEKCRATVCKKDSHW